MCFRPAGTSMPVNNKESDILDHPSVFYRGTPDVDAFPVFAGDSTVFAGGTRTEPVALGESDISPFCRDSRSKVK